MGAGDDTEQIKLVDLNPESNGWKEGTTLNS
jgi:hypothetical protein